MERNAPNFPKPCDIYVQNYKNMSLQWVDQRLLFLKILICLVQICLDMVLTNVSRSTSDFFDSFTIVCSKLPSGCNCRNICQLILSKASTYLQDSESLFEAVKTCCQPLLDLFGVGTTARACLQHPVVNTLDQYCSTAVS